MLPITPISLSLHRVSNPARCLTRAVCHQQHLVDESPLAESNRYHVLTTDACLPLSPRRLIGPRRVELRPPVSKTGMLP